MPVAAKIDSPAATINSARMPLSALRNVTRRSSSAIPKPPITPASVPQPNC